MRLSVIPMPLCVAALVLVVSAEYLLTDFRLRVPLEPGSPLRTDIQDALVFSDLRSDDGAPVIAAIQRSTQSDFEGLLVDLDGADVSSPTYRVSQQNSVVRISTHALANSSKSPCRTFFELSLPEKDRAESVTIEGNPTDGGDRAGKSGNVEFDLRTLTATADLSIELDPGKSGVPADCAGEFSVDKVQYRLGGLNPITFHLKPGKRASFRFSRQPGADGEVRLSSSFAASEIVIRRPDGAMSGRYSSRNQRGISVEELIVHPSSIECRLSGEALWFDSGGRHWREWASQNPGRLLWYLSTNLALLGALFYPWRKPAVVLLPVGAGSLPPQRPYIFISYVRSDLDYASPFVQALRAADVEVVYDSDFKGGEQWVKMLHSLIEKCLAFVILMTPESTNSNWVTREILLAQTAGRRMLPVVVRDTINPLLIDLQQIDARQNRDPVPELLGRLRALGYPFAAHGTGSGGQR
jgi:hypothetical protein